MEFIIYLILLSPIIYVVWDYMRERNPYDKYEKKGMMWFVIGYALLLLWCASIGSPSNNNTYMGDNPPADAIEAMYGF